MTLLEPSCIIFLMLTLLLRVLTIIIMVKAVYKFKIDKYLKK